MYLYYTMIVMSLTTLLDKKSPLFSELCLQSETPVSREFLFAPILLFRNDAVCAWFKFIEHIYTILIGICELDR